MFVIKHDGQALGNGDKDGAVPWDVLSTLSPILCSIRLVGHVFNKLTLLRETATGAVRTRGSVRAEATTTVSRRLEIDGIK